jgi:hypothetical protein
MKRSCSSGTGGKALWIGASGPEITDSVATATPIAPPNRHTMQGTEAVA